MGLTCKEKKYREYLRTFIGFGIVFGFLAAFSSVNVYAAENDSRPARVQGAVKAEIENEQGSKRKGVDKVAEYIKRAEKTLNGKVAKYLKDAERELHKNNFSRARSYIEKASEVKNQGQEKIREKARELAEREVYLKVERAALKKLAGEVSPGESFSVMGDSGSESIQKKRKEAQTLLENIEAAEKNYKNTKQVKQETSPGKKELLRRAREKKREEATRAKKERELKIQNEKMEKYLEQAQAFLDNNEFSKARGYVKKAMAIKNESQKRLEKQKSEEKKKRKKTEKERARREKKVAELLKQGELALEAKKFERARGYIKKAFSVDEGNAEAEEMVLKVTEGEAAFKEQKRQAKQAALLAEAEKERARREKKVAGFLKQAETAFKAKKFEKARGYVKKAFSADEGNAEAEEMVLKVAEGEAAFKEQKRQAKQAALLTESEKERAYREKKVAELLKQAETALDSNKFDRARGFANKAASADEENGAAADILNQIDEAERIFSANKKRKKEDKIRARREKARAAREANTAKYMNKARAALERNSFGKAAGYAERAFESDPNDLAVRDILNRIAREKEDFKNRKKRKKVETKRPEKKKEVSVKDKRSVPEKAVSRELGSPRRRFAPRKLAARRAEKEEKKKKVAEEKRQTAEKKKSIAEEKKRAVEKKKKIAEEKKRSKKIAKLLSEARKELGENNFSKAAGCVEKALKTDKNNAIARELEIKISKAASDYRKKEEIAARDEARRVKADKAREKRDRREAKKKKIREEKLEKYLAEAGKYLEKNSYSTARKYAYKAKYIDPTSSVVALLIADIDKGEMFGIKKADQARRERETKEALKEFDTREGDVFTKDDEGKEWYEYITDIFKKRVYRLGKVQEGRIYTIDECVQLALQRSQRMKVADKQVTLAKTRLWETRRELLPSVTTRIERSTGKIGTSTGPRHYQGEKYQVELKHNVFDGMGTWFTVRQSQTNLEVVELEREKVKNEVVGETKTSYYNLDKSVKAFAIQEMYKKRINNYYRIAEASFDQNLVAEMEYLKVKGQNMQANFQYDSSKEDITLAETILYQAMNVDPECPINIQPVAPPKETLTIGLENCYRLAFANRPDFKIKEKMIEYYDFDRKISKAKAWPKVDFQGSFGNAVETYQPTTDNEEQRGLSAEWYAGVQASVPIWGNTLEYSYVREKWAPVVSSFHGTESATSYLSIKFLDDMAYFTNLAESRAGFESAKYEYLKYKKDLIVEVKETYFKYRKALLQIDVAEAQVDHQKMFVGVLEERRLFGEMELSKIIEEYEKFSEHQYGAIQGYASYYIALAELNKAIGVPDYFDPGHEDQEYGVWDAELIIDEPARVENIMEIKNPVVSGEVLPDGVIVGGK
ncbi:MAG: TolC family protein [Candidatus Omnitrophica bacterium]|nr:TolC family protein [Candidatus Omnitrophota bacterium]